MDIKLDKIQRDLSKEARRFLKKEASMEYVREMFEDNRGYTEPVWKKMAAMDWMRIRIPEEYNGFEMGQLDLCVILEEMGRNALPGPFFSTVQLAAEAIITAGSSDQKKTYLPKIGDGKILGTLAVTEPESGNDIDYIQMPATKNGDSFVLNGTKIAVPEAQVADFIVIAARSASTPDPLQGITLFLVDSAAEGLTVTLLPGMDGTRKLCAVELKNVKPLDVLGEINQGRAPLDKVLQRAQVGLAAECVGGAQRAMEIASEYAKMRTQFNQPIGAFQAIKHACAQMYVEVETGRSLLYWAAWAQDNADEKEAALSASVVKAHCAEAYTKVAGNALQVQGGIGFTWESDIHLYLKRAKCNELSLGDPAFHREKIVQLLTKK